MAIPFSCPHCGKSTMVDDRYAGQSGPCAACGQTITVPLVATGAAPSSVAGWGVFGTLLVVGGVGGVVCLGVIGILVALLLPAVQQARLAGRQAQSMNNMKQIGIALHNYHDTHQALPPAYVSDASGKPLYSWRVLILPYLERADLYDRFDKTKAWDSPENMAISSQMMPIFQSMNDESTDTTRTNYFTVVGANAPGQRTLLVPDSPTSFAVVTDGLSNSLMVIELKGIRGSWAAPIDPTLAQIQAGVGTGPGQLTPCQPRDALVGLADGSVRRSPLPDLNRALPTLVIVNDGMVTPEY